jgi:hypothetical protein
MYVRPEAHVYRSTNTGQDYVDACERLAQLNLTEVQQREVIRVLVNCCGDVSTHRNPMTVADPNFRKRLITLITHLFANIFAEPPTRIRLHYSFVSGISYATSERLRLAGQKSSKT